MQKIYLDNFIRDIEDIKEYIKHINIINQLEKETKNIENEALINFNQHLHSFSREKKLFEYKAIIISLYGILENTISKWIQTHIQNVSNIVNDYNKLEDKFKIRHFNLSIQLISLISEKKHSKFDNMNKEDILNKLNNSIVNPTEFELNSEAYIPLSGNLKHTKIIEAFQPLEINFDKFNHNFNGEILKIDDLVLLRNEIAHGVQIDNILGITEFEDFVSTLEKYMRSIFNIMSEKEIEYQFKHQTPIYIDETKEVFQKNTVCIITIKDTEIQIGDSLFIEKDNKISETIILDIRKDDVSIQSVNDGEVGLKLDCTIKKNSKIWKLQS